MDATVSPEPWQGDLLDHAEIGETFTRLVQSVDPGKEKTSKVISIEAGFGWGKTFFRRRWAKHLEVLGEVVIQIDAQKSDHSGDPVVTFLGALMERLDPDPKERSKKLKAAAWKWSGVAGRAVGGALIGRAIDGVVDAAKDAIDDDESLWDAGVEGISEGLSKAAKGMIAAQIAAEAARQKLPDQIDALRKAVAGEGKRIVIIIDELDRCHPDYVIALLEAMKLVFQRPGFIFVLMVNDKQLDAQATQRFGQVEHGERYLDKFVDLRLKLEPSAKALADASAVLLRQQMPDYVPYGDDPEFSLDRAAALIAQIVEANGPQAITMRQIKRIVDRLELVLRCYEGTPIDLPLLVWLALPASVQYDENWLPRSSLTKAYGEKQLMQVRKAHNRHGPDGSIEVLNKLILFLGERAPELLSLSPERYSDESPGNAVQSYRVISGLCPHYIPSHQAMLDYVHRFQADAPV